jgi:hypothetical protein
MPTERLSVGRRCPPRLELNYRIVLLADDLERLPKRLPPSASSRRQSAVIGRQDSEVLQAVDLVVDSDLPGAVGEANVGRRRQCRSTRAPTQPFGWCCT